jgi:antitoxin component YwqK of YwqJK toxin-antitoxin module
MIKILFHILLMLSTGYCFSQSDTLNQIDSTGLKQGHWVFLGADKPNKGLCDTCIYEEGRYVNDRKEGEWIRYHKDGLTPKLIGEYKRGRPNGLYTKYYASGDLRESGNFERGKYQGIHRRYFESGCLEYEEFNDSIGQDGDEYYYYNNCVAVSDIIRGQIELMHIHDTVTGESTKYRYYRDGDVREIIIYSKDGRVKSQETSTRTDAIHCGPGNRRVRKEMLEKDQYYPDGSIRYEGEFRDGKLVNGRHYVYDADGILLKVEVFKKGRYHSDGQVEEKR